MIKMRVKVRPNSRTSRLEGPGQDGIWQASLKSLPVAGKANLELRKLVSAHYKCMLSQVTIKHGESSRVKMLQIDAE